MTVGKIAKQICFYLGKSRSDFVVDNNDVLIDAMNHVRKDAERGYEFLNQQAEAWLSVSAGAEASLSDAKLISSAGAFTTTACSVRAVDTLYLGDDVTLTSYYPIYHDSKRLRGIKAREQYQFRGSQNFIDLPRYPGSYFAQSPTQEYSVIFQGDRLMFNPAFSTTKKVAMDVTLWMDDYVRDYLSILSASTASTSVTLNVAAPANVVAGTIITGVGTVSSINAARTTITLSGNSSANVTNAWTAYTNPLNVTPGNGGEDYENWFLEYGSDYILWGALCHLNLFTNTFAPRTEGYNAPPEKARDTALLKLYTADRLLWDQGRIGLRNR
jgi:hypothetical protein